LVCCQLHIIQSQNASVDYICSSQIVPWNKLGQQYPPLAASNNAQSTESLNLQAWAIISSNPLIESHPTYSNVFTNRRTNLPLCSGFSRQDIWAYICLILHSRIEIGFNSTCYYHLERAIHQSHRIKL
jgi:hypothetical protein